MRKIFCCLFALVTAFGVLPAFSASFSCGAGYVLADHDKIDGLDAKECVKLWCRDLELDKPMGAGNRANSGYRDTVSSDSLGGTIECFGDRKWCSGEKPGVWTPEVGMYVREGDDGSTYTSYQKGGCFAWRLEKPTDCPAGKVAVLGEDGKWGCGEPAGGKINRASSVRRTGTLRRVVR